MVIIDRVVKLYLHPFLNTTRINKNAIIICMLSCVLHYFHLFLPFLFNKSLLKLICLTIPNKNENIFLTNPLSCCVMIVTMALLANLGVFNITLLNSSA